jgi:hypothetical protein
MAKINRFFNPSLSGYQSQFVPMELPADLMLKGLLAKQAKADEITNKVNILAEYDQRALGWHDTEYVKGFKNKAQLLQDQAMQTDVTDPDFQRSYFNLARELKTDEGLKKVENAVNTHDQYLERYKELVKKGAHADAEALRFSYETRLGEYTKEGGKGFTGDILLGNPLTTEGLNIQEGLEKLFNDIKASGSEQARSFKDALGAKYSYETGFEGVTDKRVQQQLNNIKNNLLDSPEGKQLRAEALMKLDLPDFKYEKLSKEERSKVDGQIENYIMGKALAVGKEFVYGKSSSNLAEAQQKANDRVYEKAKEEGTVLTGTMEMITEGNPDLTWDGQIKKIDESNAADYKELWKAKNDPNYMSKEMAQEIQLRINERTKTKSILNQDKNKAWNEMLAKHPEDAKKFNELNKILDAKSRKGIRLDGKTMSIKEYVDSRGGAINAVKTTSNSDIKKLIMEYYKAKTDLQKFSGEIKGGQSKLAKEWQETYYPSNSKTSQVEIGYTTTPAGATSKKEEQMINAKQGYTFNDASGTPIQDVGLIKEGSFKMIGLSQEGVNNKGIARIGTVVMRQPVYDKDGKLTKYNEYEKRVIVTSNNPNDYNTQRGYVRDYYQQANSLKAQGKEFEAANAEAQALRMISPKLNEEFAKLNRNTTDNGGKSFKTGVIPNIMISDGDNVVKTDVIINRTGSGEYQIINHETNNIIGSSTDYDEVKRFFINANLGIYE